MAAAKKQYKRWDDASKVEEVIWQMRLADLPRGQNREIINTLYNGDPPFSDQEAEDNQVQINRNDLTGANMMTQARRQWTQALLKAGNYFTVTYDSGDKHKRREWGHSVTRHINNLLHRAPQYFEQGRASGATTLLHGMGPSVWTDRRSVLCKPIDISSVMIPSETEIGFDNLEYIAFFQEWTPAQLYKMTHGFRVDPGWQMDVVDANWNYIREQVQKQPNATAFQYMPERIGELYKQDMGWWGSDAVPTVDVWDFYFRSDDSDGGWRRRIIPDWGVSVDGMKASQTRPTDRPTSGKFLYTSGNKKFANSISEILHCQWGDCSPVFPQRVHSVRALGWMLWGIADLENRLHCKFSEALFEQLMWFFSVASNADMVRLKRADFYHMGVIPQGIKWLGDNERFKPDPNIIKMGFARYQKLLNDNASSFTRDFDDQSSREMTATETMARVNAVNTLVSGLLTIAYNYEEFKDREILRRACIRNNPDPIAIRFRELCFADGVPQDMLDVDRMNIARERSFGAGNKTLEMAIVQFLQTIRKNAGPDGQRRIDHISVEIATDDPALAEELFPTEGQKRISSSMHDAELATDRLMRGLPYAEQPEMVYGDYVKVWITDLAIMVGGVVQSGGMASPDDIRGFQNMAAKIGEFLKIMAQNEEDGPLVSAYEKNLSDLMNHVKAFEQRLAQAAKAQAQNGAGGIDGKTIGQIRAQEILAQTKSKIQEQRSAQRMAQDQVRFEQAQRQKEREHNAELRRTGTEHYFTQLTNFDQQRTKRREPNGEPTTTE